MGGAPVVLTDEVRQRIARLQLAARTLVEGSVSGLHRSPLQGFSVEFAQHREYAWGDELRHLDWKVFARTDRFYVKQYEEETNLYAVCLVDASASMAYGGQRAACSKYEYGATLAAALTYLLLRQQDAVALTLFGEDELARIPMSGHPGQLRHVCDAMAGIDLQAESGDPPVLERLAESLRRRGVVILISDLLFPSETLLKGLRHLRHRGHEAIVLHLVDPDELDLPFDGPTRFVGLEGAADLLADPRGLRQAYVAAMERFLGQVESGCREARADYHRIDTHHSPALNLARVLTQRRGRSAARGSWS